MTRRDYRTFPGVLYECTGCGTVHPEEIITGYDEPPANIRAICGTRWGGCGRERDHTRVDARLFGDDWRSRLDVEGSA